MAQAIVPRALVLFAGLMLALALPESAWSQTGAPADLAAEQRPLGFRTVGVEQGLPHYGVYGVAQDRFGFIWLGTLDGLVRYDGHQLAVHRPDPLSPGGLSGGQIWCLRADRDGVIWAGTIASGLSSYDPRTERFTSYRHNPDDPTSLSSDAIRAIYEDSTGTLWVGTLNGGLNRLDRQSGRFTRYGHDPYDQHSLSHDHVEDIVEDGRGGLWVATYGGLDRLDPATGRFTHLRYDPDDPTTIGGNAVNALLRDRSGTLWVGVYGAGLFRLNEADGRFSAYRSDPDDPDSLSSNNVSALVEGGGGTIWVGTYGGGLNRLDPATGRFTHFHGTRQTGRAILSDSIMSLHMDADGLLWAGTETNGVTIIDPEAKAFQIYHASPEFDGAALPAVLRPGAATSVVEDHDGTLWIVVADVGLEHFDRERGTVTHYSHNPDEPASLLGTRPHALLVDRGGTLWIGYFDGGLSRFDRAADAFIHYSHDPKDLYSPSPNAVWDLHEGRDGAIWAATRGGGLSRLDPATGRVTHYRHDPEDPTTISSNSLLALAEDQGGAIWVGTEDMGLSRLDPATGRFTHYYHDPEDPSSPGSHTVPVLFVDSGGVLWAAVWNSGLDRFDRASGTFTHYRDKDGILTSKINGIQEDADGNLWLSSNWGLTRFNPESGATAHFTSTSAGLPSGGYPMNSSGKSRSGEILLGAIDSLVTFFPEQIRTRSEVAPVVFSRFLLANQPVTVGDGSPLASSINATETLTLSYFDRVVSFEFATLDYRTPQAVRYRYRLDGFDREWIETGSERPFATYTNLDPGRYVLRVIAMNGDGVWGEQERRIALTITPPWWQTWWFTTLSVLATASLVAGTFRYRLHSLNFRQHQLEAEVAARTAELSAANASLGVQVLERTRAEEAARAARDELDRQLTIERELITTRDLDVILGGILDQIGLVISYATAAILTPDGDRLVLRALRSTYLSQPLQEVRFELRRVPQLAQALTMSEPLVYTDLAEDVALLEYLAEAIGQPVRGRSWLVMPLLAHGQAVGLLLLAYDDPGRHSADDVRKLTTFASPVAMALQNDSLHRAAEAAAVQEERNRIARDLHDAVTQTLFSANLIAEALPEVMRESPARASKGLKELYQLTAGALAEMRTLLLELRPKSLTEKPIGQLLQPLCKSLSSRTASIVNLTVARDCILDTPVQLTLYRVAQEALNNAVKHANAQQIVVHSDCTRDEALLQVTDNGRGFECAKVGPGSLGLGIMQERAAEIGASLTITSEVGGGTTLTLHWRAPG